MTENTDRSPTDAPDGSNWGPCPSGEISGMVNRLCHQRKLTSVARASAVATALMLGTAIWLFVPPANQNTGASENDYEYGSICCSDVIGYAAAFHNGELDQEKVAQIRQHIAECPHCGPEYEKLRTQPHSADNRDHRQRDTVLLADVLAR